MPSIDHALLAALDQSSSEEPTSRRIGIDNPYEGPKAMLLAAVAEANRSRTVWSRELGFSTVIGLPADLDAVELLFTSLLVRATTAIMHAGSQTDGYGRSRTRSFRQSFLTAYATRIGQRLAEATGKETGKLASGPAGRNLLPVLAVRSEAVDDALAAMFPEMTHHAEGSATDREAWFSGLSAADRASLHVDGERVGSGSVTRRPRSSDSVWGCAQLRGAARFGDCARRRSSVHNDQYVPHPAGGLWLA